MKGCSLFWGVVGLLNLFDLDVETQKGFGSYRASVCLDYTLVHTTAYMRL